MTEAMDKQEYSRIKIVMERSFTNFSQEEQEEFLDDLSRLSGSPRKEIRKIRFLEGCVVFEGELRKEAVARLLELFQNRGDSSDSEDLVEFMAALKKHYISLVDGKTDATLRIITSRKSESKAIVFIHGWKGDADSFGKMPQFLSSKFNCSTAIYPYPTGLLSDAPSIVFISRNLDNWIRNNCSHKKLAVIAHSMGGLVARKLLVSQSWRKDPLDRFVKLATFIASPHNGAAYAGIARTIEALKSAQIEELDPNSSFLFDLNEQWMHWVSKHVPRDCKVRSIVGTKDKIVSINNATGLDSEAVPILGVGHIDIVKPNKSDSEIVITLERFLSESGF